MRRNPLLAKSPHAAHSRGAVKEPDAMFRAVMGRGIEKSDWDGLHVTPDFVLAAVYAMSISKRQESWPVVFELDVHGLKALPDIDAIAHGGLILEANWRAYHEALERGQPWPTSEPFESEEKEDSPLAAYVDMAMNHGDIETAFEAAFGAKAEAKLKQWAKTGKAPPEVMIALVGQERYLKDFGEERLCRASIVKPWFDSIISEDMLELMQEDPDAPDARILLDLEQGGYQIVSNEDVWNYNLNAEVVWFQKFRQAKQSRFHGTSLEFARKAFPQVDWPDLGPSPYALG